MQMECVSDICILRGVHLLAKTPYNLAILKLKSLLKKSLNCIKIIVIRQEESRSFSENVTWGQRKRFADGKVSLPYKLFLEGS